MGFVRIIVEAAGFGLAAGLITALLVVVIKIVLRSRAASAAAYKDLLAKNEIYRLEQEAIRKARESDEAAVRKWAAGDSSLREQVLSYLESQQIAAPMLAVLERFVSDPPSFRCRVLQGVSSGNGLYCNEAIETNSGSDTTVYLYFGANTQQHITNPGNKDFPTSLPTDTLSLQVLRSDPGEEKKVTVLGNYRTMHHVVLRAAEIAYGRSVTYKSAPKSQDLEL